MGVGLRDHYQGTRMSSTECTSRSEPVSDTNGTHELGSKFPDAATTAQARSPHADLLFERRLQWPRQKVLGALSWLSDDRAERILCGGRRPNRGYSNEKGPDGDIGLGCGSRAAVVRATEASAQALKKTG